jgi:hypothetical protein
MDLNEDQRDGLRRIFAHAAHDERTVMSAAIHGVTKRPLKARGVDIAWSLLQRAVNIDRRQSRVGSTGYPCNEIQALAGILPSYDALGLVAGFLQNPATLPAKKSQTLRTPKENHYRNVAHEYF